MAGNLEAIFGHVLTTDPDPAPPVATPEDQLLDAMTRAGLRVPDRIILDGKIHRFNSDEKRIKQVGMLATGTPLLQEHLAAGGRASRRPGGLISAGA